MSYNFTMDINNKKQLIIFGIILFVVVASFTYVFLAFNTTYETILENETQVTMDNISEILNESEEIIDVVENNTTIVENISIEEITFNESLN